MLLGGLVGGRIATGPRAAPVVDPIGAAIAAAGLRSACQYPARFLIPCVPSLMVSVFARLSLSVGPSLPKAQKIRGSGEHVHGWHLRFAVRARQYSRLPDTWVVGLITAAQLAAVAPPERCFSGDRRHGLSLSLWWEFAEPTGNGGSGGEPNVDVSCAISGC